MASRRPASRVLFVVACLLWGGALAMLLAARILPSEGFQDLGRVVGAMMLAALAVVPFGLALFVGRGTRMPLWMLVLSWIGIAASLVPTIALLSVVIG